MGKKNTNLNGIFTSRDSSETTSWLAQDHVAAWAQHDRLGMAKNRGDFHTALIILQN